MFLSGRWKYFNERISSYSVRVIWSFICVLRGLICADINAYICVHVVSIRKNVPASGCTDLHLAVGDDVGFRIFTIHSERNPTVIFISSYPCIYI